MISSATMRSKRPSKTGGRRRVPDRVGRPLVRGLAPGELDRVRRDVRADRLVAQLGEHLGHVAVRAADLERAAPGPVEQLAVGASRARRTASCGTSRWSSRARRAARRARSSRRRTSSLTAAPRPAAPAARGAVAPTPRPAAGARRRAEPPEDAQCAADPPERRGGEADRRDARGRGDDVGVGVPERDGVRARRGAREVPARRVGLGEHEQAAADVVEARRRADALVTDHGARRSARRGRRHRAADRPRRRRPPRTGRRG